MSPDPTRPDPPPATAPGLPPADWFVRIIEAVRQPIGFFALTCLVLTVLVAATLAAGWPELVYVFAGLLGLVIVTFVGLLARDPKVFSPQAAPAPAEPAPPVEQFKPPPSPTPAPTPPGEPDWEQIYSPGGPPPDMDAWYRQLRPTLHQASFYTVPTYYLDADLNVLDFNLAFDLLFRDIAGRLRGRHVNWFIDKLANRAAVIRHGVEFTNRTRQSGCFPFVDLEPIEYDSTRFGRVTFTKVASQLHDPEGRLKGWAVALMVRALADWPAFEGALRDKLFQDKLWSVYSGPYDRVLTRFPPYAQLVKDVTAVIPGPGLTVGDLGAGTGNVTAALLADGHRVYAVETNIGMLDRFALKHRGRAGVSLVKGAVEDLACFKPGIFDAVVMVNVLYAVDDPLGCLREVHRLLKPGGVLGFSTTHRETRLDALLAAIDAAVRAAEPKPGGPLRADYEVLARANREIEQTIARRHSRADYRGWVEQAGFEITRLVDSTYHDAVMLVHARKR